MGQIFFTNTARDFSEIKKIEGTLGKPKLASDKIPENCFLFREENPEGKKPKMFNLKKINSLKFFAKRYWYFILLISTLSILYIFYTPLVAIMFFVAMETFLYYYNPFSSLKKAKQTFFWLKAVALVLFIGTGYKLFGSLDNIDNTLRLTQTTLLATLIAFARYNAQGIYNKYKEIYALVDDCETSEEKTEIFVWKKQI